MHTDTKERARASCIGRVSRSISFAFDFSFCAMRSHWLRHACMGVSVLLIADVYVQAALSHTYERSCFYSLLSRFCCCCCGMRTQMTCACAMDICCIYTVCFIVTFSICAKTMCRWPLFTDLQHATHKNILFAFLFVSCIRYFANSVRFWQCRTCLMSRLIY